jgi:hypothetical protein
MSRFRARSEVVHCRYSSETYWNPADKAPDRPIKRRSFGHAKSCDTPGALNCTSRNDNSSFAQKSFSAGPQNILDLNLQQISEVHLRSKKLVVIGHFRFALVDGGTV